MTAAKESHVRITYTPDQVRDWTNEDLRSLVGKFMVVAVPVRFQPGSWEIVADICGHAERLDGPGVRLMPGSILELKECHQARVLSCAEHGDHTSADGRLCVKTFVSGLEATQ